MYRRTYFCTIQALRRSSTKRLRLMVRRTQDWARITTCCDDKAVGEPGCSCGRCMWYARGTLKYLNWR